ncbi:phosphoglycerate kinase [endosymbiont of Euscepes postfasciatus]|uniref:phosphoglycerate kinase n=1 Tax=endosymbiont of Euscepes postfasciatus TaxID=650377 RepID=UPI000DC6E959|nr:phosphoglycerate kinase [endosymbiont of Euscepes postfasciatus]BBA84641.1 phosphoglycerate kinase [endosymbiont of Euscepes postfasciatus]
MLSIKDIKINNKILLIRSDFNVPIKNNKILSDIKILDSLETIKYALSNKAYIIIFSNLGDNYNKYFPLFSLEIIKKYLEKKLKVKINLIKNYLYKKNINVKKNEIYLLENVMFNNGEIKNNENLSKKYASLCDIFVMDSFSYSFMFHSSTYGVAKFAKISCCGLSFYKKANNLYTIFNQNRKIVSIIGGCNINKKILFIKKISIISYKIFIGGVIANDLLLFNNYKIGKSIIDYDINDNNNKNNSLEDLNNIILPNDVKTSINISKNSICKNKLINNINSNDIIVDLGSKYIKNIIDNIENIDILLWIGSIGIFEISNFSNGTKLILDNISKNKNLKSIIVGYSNFISLKKFNYIKKIYFYYIDSYTLFKFIENFNIPIIKYFT